MCPGFIDEETEEQGAGEADDSAECHKKWTQSCVLLLIVYF